MAQHYVSQAEILGLLNLIRPRHMVNSFKVRIGADADGGYVLPASARNTNLVLSIGIGEEVSFDVELAAAGAGILQFDHTIECAPLEHQNIRFLRKGWGPWDTDILLSLRTMASLVNWDAARHPILKFDTEGAEWETLEHTDSKDLARFEVITGEFHYFEQLINRDFFDRVHAVFTKLAATHHVIHLHGNNAGGFIMVQGIAMPRLLELSYWRQNAGVFGGHSSEPIPGPLDRPNIPGAPDLCLRPF